MTDGKTKSGGASPLAAKLLVTVACMMLFMLNNGVRSNFGLISSAVRESTGLPEESISFAVAIAQLLYGLSQPFFGLLALKKSNSFVLGVGSILMGAGLLLIPLSGSAWMLCLSLGLLVGLAAGAILAPYLQTMTDHGAFAQGMIGLACVSGCVALLCIWLNKKERDAAAFKTDEAPVIAKYSPQPLPAAGLCALRCLSLPADFSWQLLKPISIRSLFPTASPEARLLSSLRFTSLWA